MCNQGDHPPYRRAIEQYDTVITPSGDNGFVEDTYFAIDGRTRWATVRMSIRFGRSSELLMVKTSELEFVRSGDTAEDA